MLQLSRRRFVQFAATAAGLPTMASAASAQTYPSRPVRIVVGFPPGGGVDILARLMGQWLSERLGQSHIIENRAGAGGNLATEAVVRAPPDGYSLLLATTSDAINATLYERLSFNFIRDVAPVGALIRVPLVMVVKPSLDIASVPEFIAYAKANSGKVNMGLGGIGGAPHMAGELFKVMTGVTMTNVPYRGLAPALTGLLGGQVEVVFSSVPAAIEYIRAGRLRALAVTSAVRTEALPDLPTVVDFVPGFEASQWYGIGVPKGTPGDIVDRLNKQINAGLADPKMEPRLADLGGTALAGSPADFGRLIAVETEKWGKVIQANNIKPE
jgi:tripartite-type tricarboxylate transporter receptor subunit TctC